ncbi:T9SS type A sorting domain-containing protein [Taibaiella koreensis]|uniref:T9SS type A sorting domain-containing protein n=1 Tax=Taibaiella koreensis TaxID=1268548 RepID=UPI000E59FBAB|nr:T9SS type A sorting domain-containing protein [Taibaiella koreensis]
MKNRALPIKRWGLALSLAISCLGVNKSSAQLAANTYQFSAINGTFTEVTGGTAVTSIQTDDAQSASINIGFTFNYCGTDYNSFVANSNGWISFGPGTTNTSTMRENNTANLTTIKPALLPLWDDLDGSSGNASYQLTGTAPNQVLTFQWKNWKWYWLSSVNMSFQVKLYQTSNIVEFVYRQEGSTGSPSGATIGIGDNDATAGYLVLNNATAAPTASPTVWTDNIAARPANGQVYRFKPMPSFDMDADSIIVAEPFCSNSTQPIKARLSNLGTATITSLTVNWSIDGVLQTPIAYSGAPITNFGTAPNNNATIVLGDVFFPDATPRNIKVWTSQPNSNADEIPANDTAKRAVAAALQGVDVDLQPSDTTICQGHSIVLDAGGFPKHPIYIWSTGSLDSAITVSSPGTYSVKVQNTDGCFDRDTIVVSVYPNPLLNSVAVVDNGDKSFTFNALGAQNVTSYKWDFGDGSAPVTGDGVPGQVIHPFTTPGDYTVTLTLYNNCSEVSRTVVIHIPDVPANSIDELDALRKEIRIYPNPGKDMITVSHNSGLKINQVEIYNLTGQRMMSITVKSDKQQINISGMAAGIYNVTIGTDKGKVTKKLEVIR